MGLGFPSAYDSENFPESLTILGFWPLWYGTRSDMAEMQ